MASQNWQSERKRLEGLSLEERRKNYYCGDKFIPLSEIPTWKEYFLENEKSLTEKGILLESLSPFYLRTYLPNPIA